MFYIKLMFSMFFIIFLLIDQINNLYLKMLEINVRYFMFNNVFMLFKLIKH